MEVLKCKITEGKVPFDTPKSPSGGQVCVMKCRNVATVSVPTNARKWFSVSRHNKRLPTKRNTRNI
ncbi:hypothetical protein RvY_00246 [Ramazzottius varieornatus]|uniref:Uncharacterized protein n=1 Tax=Ramazzottius varieornatus TaxID=947166 RepID=A0A1D1UM08_RAMVA|nr:hypothetical protein RvY_00246 [Ramazzottius varieornatus]